MREPRSQEEEDQKQTEEEAEAVAGRKRDEELGEGCAFDTRDSRTKVC